MLSFDDKAKIMFVLAEKYYAESIAKFKEECGIVLPPWSEMPNDKKHVFCSGFLLGMQAKADIDKGEVQAKEIINKSAEAHKEDIKQAVDLKNQMVADGIIKDKDMEKKDGGNEAVIIAIATPEGEPLVVMGVGSGKFKSNRELLDTLVAAMGADPRGVERAIENLDTCQPLKPLVKH